MGPTQPSPPSPDLGYVLGLVPPGPPPAAMQLCTQGSLPACRSLCSAYVPSTCPPAAALPQPTCLPDVALPLTPLLVPGVEVEKAGVRARGAGQEAEAGLPHKWERVRGWGGRQGGVRAEVQVARLPAPPSIRPVALSPLPIHQGPGTCRLPRSCTDPRLLSM